MDKKNKEALRHYKKAKVSGGGESSSDSSSSSSDSESGSSSSYSSSSSEHHRRHKKVRQTAAATGGHTDANVRRFATSSDEEKRKRERREHCQKKLEAKRNHIKRKLKEAKLKKKAAAAAAALSGHSHRALSPATQAKLKKLAERKHLREVSKEKREREREREKHRTTVKDREREKEREREREHHRNISGVRVTPTKITKIRIHQDVQKRPKSPPRVHQQLMAREKIIIQTRNRERTPSIERERLRLDYKMRHDELARERDRREREIAREKERAEALARCQERQRERERLAREKLRREEDEKYGKRVNTDIERDRERERDRGERLVPLSNDRDIVTTTPTARGYSSHERSIDHMKRDLDPYELTYLRKHRDSGEYLCNDEHERRSIMGREELYRERDYMETRHCREISPSEYNRHRNERLHTDRRELFLDEDRERGYGRTYMESGRCHPEGREAWLAANRDIRECDIRELRDYRNMDPNHMYANERDRERDRERERLGTERERSFGNRVPPDWKHDWNSPHEQRGAEWLEKNNPLARNIPPYHGPNKRGNMVVGNKPNNIPLSNKITTSTGEHGIPSDGNWKNDENPLENLKQTENVGIHHEGSTQRNWMDHENRGEMVINTSTATANRQWNQDWRENPDNTNYQRGPHIHQIRSDRGGRGGYRRGTGLMDHSIERGYRSAHNTVTSQSNLLNLQNQISSGYPRFPNKRLTYMNPNLIKKQQGNVAISKGGNTIPTSNSNIETKTSISKIVITSTVTSSTNATITNTTITTTTNSNLSTSLVNETTLTNSLPTTLPSIKENIKQEDTTTEIIAEKAIATGNITNTVIENADNATLDSLMTASGELSEISDTDDEILNKTDKKKDDTTDVEMKTMEIKNDDLLQSSTKDEKINNIKDVEDKCDVDLLDFEEISDGELEEDARNRGVGDALGVDWASLIAEAKQPTKDIITTAKQKWQTHHIILDVGISMYFAGESYAKKLLNEAQLKLDKELQEQQQISSTTNIDDNGKENKETLVTSSISNNSKEVNDSEITNEEELKNSNESTSPKIKIENETKEIHPIACVQVAKRRSYLEQEQLFRNICGPNSRALCARQDLKLRRYLCGLPTNDLGPMTAIPKASDQIKSMALSIFQAANEIDVN